MFSSVSLSAVSLLFVFIVRRCGATGGNNCSSPSAMQPTNYKGRFFKDSTISGGDIFKTFTAETIYACRELCVRGKNCVGVSYMSNQCRLYHTANIKDGITPMASSSVILLFPMGCAKNEIVNGGWTDWVDAGNCSVTCGGGVKTQTRVCRNPEPHCGGDSCRGNETREHVCSNIACADGTWNEWALWTIRPYDIALGTTTREQTCADGPPCTGKTTESHPCPTYAPEGTAHPDDALAACGGSFAVIDPDDWSGTIPPGIDTSPLYLVSYSPDMHCSINNIVNGGWSSWEATEPCSTPFGPEETIETRVCSEPVPSCNGAGCQGDATRTVLCPSRLGQNLTAPPNVTSVVAAGSDIHLDCTTGCNPGNCTPNYLWGTGGISAKQILSSVTPNQDQDIHVCIVTHPHATSVTVNVTFTLSVQYLTAPSNATLVVAAGSDIGLVCTTGCNPGNCLPNYSWTTGGTMGTKTLSAVTPHQDQDIHVCIVTHPDASSLTVNVTFTLSVQYLTAPPNVTSIVAPGSDITLNCTTGCNPGNCTPNYSWTTGGTSATKTLLAFNASQDEGIHVCTVTHPDATSVTVNVTLSVQHGAWNEWTLWTICPWKTANGTTTRNRTCADGPPCTGETTVSHQCPNFAPGGYVRYDDALAACGGSFAVIDPDDWSGTLPPGIHPAQLYWFSPPPGNTPCSANEKPLFLFTNGDITHATTVCSAVYPWGIGICR